MKSIIYKLIIGVFTMIILAIGVMTYSMVRVIMSQYKDTVSWQDTRLHGSISNVPPEFATNYVTKKQVDDVDTWTKVDEALTKIKKHGKIDNGDIPQLTALYDEAHHQQTVQKLTDGDIVHNITTLKLYLDLTTQLDKAYSEPNTAALEPLSHQLEQLRLDDDSSVNNAFYDRLMAVSTDYTNLSAFITDTLPVIGTVTDRIVHINPDLTSADTQSVIQVIDEQHLTRFPNIADLRTLLESKDWQSALTQNESTKRFDAWMAQKSIFESLTKQDYVKLSTITSYEDAKTAGFNVDVRERNGMTVDPKSPIRTYMYDGQELQASDYVKSGTPVTVTIDPIYKSKPTTDSTPDTSSSSDDTSSDDTDSSETLHSSSSNDTTNSTSKGDD